MDVIKICYLVVSAIWPSHNRLLRGDFTSWVLNNFILSFCLHFLVLLDYYLYFHYRVMTRKQQLRHYNLEKAEELVAAKSAQKEELVKAVKSLSSIFLG